MYQFNGNNLFSLFAYAAMCSPSEPVSEHAQHGRQLALFEQAFAALRQSVEVTFSNPEYLPAKRAVLATLDQSIAKYRVGHLEAGLQLLQSAQALALQLGGQPGAIN